MKGETCVSGIQHKGRDLQAVSHESRDLKAAEKSVISRDEGGSVQDDRRQV